MSDEAAASVDEIEPREVRGLTAAAAYIEDSLSHIRIITDRRAELRAKGIPPRTTRSIVELGLQGQYDKQKSMMKAALEESEKAEGAFAIAPAELATHIDTLLVSEREMVSLKDVARENGLDVKLLGFLTQIIEHNPGDRGASALGTLLDYARQAGTELDGIAAEASGEGGWGKESVLPKIARPEPSQQRTAVKTHALDAMLGLLIGVCVMWLVI